MKLTTIELCIVFLFLGLSTFSQEFNRLIDGRPINKGKITLKDGISLNFKKLSLQNGMIIFTDSQGNKIEKNSSDVYKVVKYEGSYAGWGAGLGGGLGFLVCLSAAAPTSDPYQILFDPNTSSTSGAKLSAGQWILITGVPAVVGVLIGSCFRKHQTVFKNNSAISFYPSVTTFNQGNLYPMLSINHSNIEWITPLLE